MRETGDWKNATVIELDNSSRKVFSDFPQLKFDAAYTARFSVLQSDGSWSGPGAESCAFRLKNFVRLYSCKSEIPIHVERVAVAIDCIREGIGRGNL